MGHQPDNIFAGTLLVSLVDVLGTTNSLIRQRGAVGVVTRTPEVDGEKLLVQFPDEFETSQSKEQFGVLKHFKDRSGDAEYDIPCAPGSGDGWLGDCDA